MIVMANAREAEPFRKLDGNVNGDQSGRKLKWD
jgi:hypothetical protein